MIDTLCEEPTWGLELLPGHDGAPAAPQPTSLLQNTALLDLGARLARLLLETEGAVVAQSQGEMARLIGASRERVNRKLAAWRSDGWIEVGAYGVKLLNREALISSAGPPPAM